MSFQGPPFFPTISWIYLSKKTCLVFLTMLLKILQSLISFETLYLLRALWYFLFYHNFECLVILTIFEHSNQICLILSANSCTICSRTSLLEIHSISSLLIESLSSARKFISSSLFLIILLKILQSLISFETLYFSGALWQSSFHHDFECLVILTIF